MSVLLTTDRAIQRLNKDYRGVDKPTNVLTFAQGAGRSQRYGPLLGDIVVAFETIEAESADCGIAFNAHLTHLIIHGFLHLLDYDHLDDNEATDMERLEIAILCDLGIANPYEISKGT